MAISGSWCGRRRTRCRDRKSAAVARLCGDWRSPAATICIPSFEPVHVIFVSRWLVYSRMPGTRMWRGFSASWDVPSSSRAPPRAGCCR
jgi:hypothetical protein